MIIKQKKLLLNIAILTSLAVSTTGYSADLTVTDGTPSIFFDDTSTAADGSEWYFGMWDGRALFYSIEQSHVVVDIYSSANSLNSIVVDTSGDINLANGSVFIDKSTNRMGIGNATPPKSLSIASGIPTIQLNDTDGKIWEINSNVNSTTLDIVNITDNNEMFKIRFDAPDDTLVLDDIGVAIGKSAATSKLDVQGKIKASFSGSSPDGLQELVEMTANNTNLAAKSDAGFVLKNAREAFSYAFRTENDIDGFSISKQGSGFRELQLLNSNDTMMGVELRLGNGAANVNGTWVNASSRSYKKNIHELSSKDAMQAMRGLKSVQYQFKNDNDNEHKLGFIAEDVPTIVATRDRKTLDPMQIVAVLTKAVQVQDKALVSKDRKIADMESRINQLERLFTSFKKNNQTE